MNLKLKNQPIFFSLNKNEENLLHECTHGYMTFTKIVLGTNVKKNEINVKEKTRGDFFLHTNRFDVDYHGKHSTNTYL